MRKNCLQFQLLDGKCWEILRPELYSFPKYGKGAGRGFVAVGESQPPAPW